MDDDWPNCDAEAVVAALSARYRFSRANAVQLLRDQGILRPRAEAEAGDDDEEKEQEEQEEQEEQDDDGIIPMLGQDLVNAAADEDDDVEEEESVEASGEESEHGHGSRWESDGASGEESEHGSDSDYPDPCCASGRCAGGGSGGGKVGKVARAKPRRGPSKASAVASQVILALFLATLKMVAEEEMEKREQACRAAAGFALSRIPGQNTGDAGWREGYHAMVAALVASEVARDGAWLQDVGKYNDLSCLACGNVTNFSTRSTLIEHYMGVHRDHCPGREEMEQLVGGGGGGGGEEGGGGGASQEEGSAGAEAYPTVVAHKHPTREAGADIKKHMKDSGTLGTYLCSSCGVAVRRHAIRLTSYFWGVKEWLYRSAAAAGGVAAAGAGAAGAAVGGSAGGAAAGGATSDGAVGAGSRFSEFLSPEAARQLLERLVGRGNGKAAAVLKLLAGDLSVHVTLAGELFVGTSMTMTPPDRWVAACNPAWTEHATGKSIAIGTLGGLTLRAARCDSAAAGAKSLEHALVTCGSGSLFVLEGNLARCALAAGEPAFGPPPDFHQSVLSSVVSVEEPCTAACKFR
jgi:hypothetical protein